MTAVATAYATEVRDMAESERELVLDSWLQYERIMPPFARAYGHGAREWVARCIGWAMPRSRMRVVCLVEMPDVVLGWAACEPGTVHYAYVKAPARHQGLCRELLQDAGVYGVRGVRMTSRPVGPMRKQAASWGWQWRPLTESEMT